MLINTGISNEKKKQTNELALFGISYPNIIILYRLKLGHLFQVQEKMKACRNSNLNVSSSRFIANGSHVNTVSLFVVVFNELKISHF